LDVIVTGGLTPSDYGEDTLERLEQQIMEEIGKQLLQ
jgi:hypothetical protein